MTTLSNRTNAFRRAARTALQTIVAAGPAVASVAAGLPARWGAVVLGVSVPVVSFAQNALEDRGILGTWLRRPTLVDPRGDAL